MAKIVRWKCTSCARQWIYPVGECIYCRKPTKKIVGTKTKVIGATQVFVPSPLHPITPYHVLILQDEYGNKMPKKTIKAFKVGDSYEDTPSSEENAVAIIRLKYDFDEAVREALALIGDIQVSPKLKILIKPNLSLPGFSFLGMCTNEKVIDSLLTILLEKGAKKENITLAEQSFFVSFDKAIAKTGILEVIKKHGVILENIADHPFEEKKAREFTFEVSTLLNKADLIINVPVIKTDMQIGMDGAFENLTRFLSKENFNELVGDIKKAVHALAVLPSVFPPFITIGDASIGLQGNGPAQYGEPGFFNLIFAARNPVAHDKIVQETLCLRKLPYVELAGQLGLGAFDLTKIQTIGCELDAVRRDIKQPIGSKLIKEEQNVH